MATYNLIPNQPFFLRPSQTTPPNVLVFPATPNDGDQIGFRVVEDDLTAFTLNPNGSTLEGTISANTNVVFPNGAMGFIYSDKTTPPGWWLTSVVDTLPALAVLDGNGWVPGSNNLGAVYQTADFTSETVPSRYVSIDLVANTFLFKIPGLYTFDLNGVFEHNASNSGRNTNVRFRNTTDSSNVGDPLIIPTGRNQEATQFATSGLIDVNSSILNKTIAVQFGGGADYLSVIFNALNLSIISEDLSLAEQA